MTDPSQYFKGRTVQEQMTEVIGYVDTRAAEVATDAIASDVAQVHQDMLDADADASAAAASAAAAAGTLANAVKKTGESSQSIAGDIAISGALSVSGAVTVPAPTGNTNAATKKYVDDADALKLNITDVNTYAVGLTGNQNVSGIKNMLTPIAGGYLTSSGSTPGSTGEYVRIARNGHYSQVHILIYGNTPNNGLGFADMLIGGSDGFGRSYTVSKKGIFSTAEFVRVSSGGRNELWIKKPANMNVVDVIIIHTTTNNIDTNVLAATGLTTLPNVGDPNPITSDNITGIEVLT